jgi:hypothetical protein
MRGRCGGSRNGRPDRGIAPVAVFVRAGHGCFDSCVYLVTDYDTHDSRGEDMKATDCARTDAVGAEAIQILIRRVDGLEIANSRLRWIVGVFSLSFALVILAGAQGRGVPETIEARAFVLRDVDGMCRASLQSNPFDGEPVLTFFDRARVACAALVSSELRFTAAGEEGANKQAYFGIDPKGNAKVSFWDSKGRESCSFGVDRNRVPSLEFLDQKGNVRMGMKLNPENNDAPDLRLLDSKGTIRAGIGIIRSELPMLYVRHASTGDAVNLGVWPDSSTGLKIFTKEGKEHVNLGTDQDGNADVKILDKHGKVILRAP